MDAPNNSDEKQEVKVMACPTCNVALVMKEQKRKVSLQGIVGIILLIAGVIGLLVGGLLVGGVIIILALIIGTVGNKETVMICPQCGTVASKI
jgi:uncharacterized protein YbaR (Trm112 family)